MSFVQAGHVHKWSMDQGGSPWGVQGLFFCRIRICGRVFCRVTENLPLSSWFTNIHETEVINRNFWSCVHCHGAVHDIDANSAGSGSGSPRAFKASFSAGSAGRCVRRGTRGANSAFRAQTPCTTQGSLTIFFFLQGTPPHPWMC